MKPHDSKWMNHDLSLILNAWELDVGIFIRDLHRNDKCDIPPQDSNQKKNTPNHIEMRVK